MTILWIFASLFLTFASGIPGLFLKPGRASGQRIATALHMIGCLSGLIAVVASYIYGPAGTEISWPLPGGALAVKIDALSAFFLLPVFLVMGTGSLYGESYWSERDHPANGRKLRFFYGTLTAGLTLVMMAGDAWLFLIGWEIVGLSAFFLVSTESDKQETLRAGWIYLIATHAATLVLFAMFGLLHSATGTWQLQPGAAQTPLLVAPILILALIGFGIKAGLMPFHVWLPEAHAAAPSHISAMLSGIVLKMGVYGLVRIMTLMPLQSWFGMSLLFAGIISGVLGVVFALAQHDLKRLLAYHSIENIGIIFIGLGAGVLGRNESWGALAMAGAMLHVWNHAFFKTLLFYSAGSVVHVTGTRKIDELGGLLRKMPFTGTAFLIGAVAICGLPPLNGFVSEWLIYVASFKNVIAGGSAKGEASILAAPALALIGALAVACFVKAFSVIFLGNPRIEKALHFHEPRSMRFAMGVLIASCIVIGVWPLTIFEVLSQATCIVMGNSRGGQEIKTLFSVLPVVSLILLPAILLAALLTTLRVIRSRKAVTWDCGYAAPRARMQYTSSSFAAPLVRLFHWALRPDVHRSREYPIFPQKGSFETHVPDPVLERILVPSISRSQRFLALARFVQAGRIQLYILYIVVTLLILLAWSTS